MVRGPSTLSSEFDRACGPRFPAADGNALAGNKPELPAVAGVNGFAPRAGGDWGGAPGFESGDLASAGAGTDDLDFDSGRTGLPAAGERFGDAGDLAAGA